MHKNKFLKIELAKMDTRVNWHFTVLVLCCHIKLPSKQQCNTTVLTISDSVGQEVECDLNGSYESL